MRGGNLLTMGGMRAAGALVLSLLAVLVPAAPSAAAEVETVPFETRVGGRDRAARPRLPAGGRAAPAGHRAAVQPVLRRPGPHLRRHRRRLDQRARSRSCSTPASPYAAVSMRGTGQSEGCMRFGDEPDQQDGAAVVSALAAQPWSNGSVGMYGHSFPAWSQMMTMAARPPALKAIVPTSGVFDLWSAAHAARRAAQRRGQRSAFGPIFTAVDRPPAAGRDQPDLPRAARALPRASPRTRTPATAPSSTSSATCASASTRQPDPDDDLDRDHLRHQRRPHPRSSRACGTGCAPTARGSCSASGATRSRPTHKPDWQQQVVALVRPLPARRAADRRRAASSSTRTTPTTGTPPTAGRRARARRRCASRAREVVPDGEQAEPVDATLPVGRQRPRPADSTSPTSRRGSTPRPAARTRSLFASRPLAEDALLAGNFELDLELTSTLPGGNLSVFLWRTAGSGRLPRPDGDVVRPRADGPAPLGDAGARQGLPGRRADARALRSHPFAATPAQGRADRRGDRRRLVGARARPAATRGITVTGGTREAAGARRIRRAARDGAPTAGGTEPPALRLRAARARRPALREPPALRDPAAAIVVRARVTVAGRRVRVTRRARAAARARRPARHAPRGRARPHRRRHTRRAARRRDTHATGRAPRSGGRPEMEAAMNAIGKRGASCSHSSSAARPR